ncbi:MAG: PKD domain-containing protein [Bacteroidota bacterium]
MTIFNKQAIAIRFFGPILFCLISSILPAQTAQVSGIINHFAAVSNIDTCLGSILVSDTSGFRKGGSFLIIQMKGATISTNNDASYGQIQSLNGAGLFERAVVDSVIQNAIFIKHRLLNKYDPAAKVQIVSIPAYQNAIVTDTLRTQSWNGTIGGILALEVSGTLTLNAPVIADGLGFKGGAAFALLANNCNFLIPQIAYVYPSGNWRSALKGESFTITASGKEMGRGPQATGGGGGNDHNSGGGGGGNMTAGGKGGNNEEPSTLGCDGYYPGLGGLGAATATNRLFLGGGGGAGHANNLLKSAGGQGGGIIILKAKTIAGTSPIISANGASAGLADGDGGGGGGAGGTILLEATNLPANLVVQAKGGQGGQVNAQNQNRCEGPGGGGAGGRIQTNVPGLSAQAGGLSGIVINSTNGCNGSNNSAAPGQTGVLGPILPIPESTIATYLLDLQTQPQNVGVCSGQSATFNITAAGVTSFQWQLNIGAGWQNILAGQGYSGFQSASLILPVVTEAQNGIEYRCLISRGNCSSVASNAATLSVNPGPTAAFQATINGPSVQFTNISTGFNTCFWDFGDGITSTLTSPTHVYQQEGGYTVILYTYNDCDTALYARTLSVLFAPNAGFTVADTTIGCESVSILFANTASTNASSFKWSFPGGNPATSVLPSPTVTYTASGTYSARQIVANGVGADTLEQAFVVQLHGLPQADFTVQIIANGLVQCNNQLQADAMLSWDFGDGTAFVTGNNPQHQYAQNGNYTITLTATNSCGANLFQKQIEIIITGVSESWGSMLPRLYPNPAKGTVLVDCSALSELPHALRLWNTKGDLVLQRTDLQTDFTRIDLNDLPSGMYYAQFVFAQKVYTVPLVIR